MMSICAITGPPQKSIEGRGVGISTNFVKKFPREVLFLSETFRSTDARGYATKPSVGINEQKIGGALIKELAKMGPEVLNDCCLTLNVRCVSNVNRERKPRGPNGHTEELRSGLKDPEMFAKKEKLLAVSFSIGLMQVGPQFET